MALEHDSPIPPPISVSEGGTLVVDGASIVFHARVGLGIDDTGTTSDIVGCGTWADSIDAAVGALRWGCASIDPPGVDHESSRPGHRCQPGTLMGGGYPSADLEDVAVTVSGPGALDRAAVSVGERRLARGAGGSPLLRPAPPAMELLNRSHVQPRAAVFRRSHLADVTILEGALRGLSA